MRAAVASSLPSGIAISPDGSAIVFDSYQRPGAQGGEGDLFVAFRNGDGSWGEAHNLGDGVNHAGTNFCPSISPDGVRIACKPRSGGTVVVYTGKQSWDKDGVETTVMKLPESQGRISASPPLWLDNRFVLIDEGGKLCGIVCGSDIRQAMGADRAHEPAVNMATSPTYSTVSMRRSPKRAIRRPMRGAAQVWMTWLTRNSRAMPALPNAFI